MTQTLVIGKHVIEKQVIEKHVIESQVIEKHVIAGQIEQVILALGARTLSLLLTSMSEMAISPQQSLEVMLNYAMQEWRLLLFPWVKIELQMFDFQRLCSSA